MHGLIFVPGIMGSELLAADSHRPVWSGDPLVLLDTLVRDPLALRRDDLQPGKLIRTIDPGGIDLYGKFLNALADRGFAEGGNLRLFPYDWRLDNQRNADRFAAELRLVAAPRIDIVAHSMGGLIVRLALLRHPDLADRVGCYIQAGSPCRGSACAFETLKTGSFCRLMD